MSFDECNPTYEVQYLVGDSTLAAYEAPVRSIKWSRRLDNISEATILHEKTNRGCCGDLGKLESWADTMIIRRNGKIVWYGWLQDIDEGRNDIVINAKDALNWLKVRIPHLNGVDYNQNADQARHFENLWHLGIDVSPINATLIIYETGVMETRKIHQKGSFKTVWPLVQDLLTGGVDVTALGNQIHVGAFVLSGPIVLGSDDFQGDVRIVKRAELYANKAYIDAGGSKSAVYPPGTAIAGGGRYPLVEDTLYDPNITDINGAQAAVKSRIDFSPIVPRIVMAGDALTLTNGAVPIEALIPASVVQLDLQDEMCSGAVQQFRLGGVDVTYESKVETITTTLQPIGTLANLEGFSQDDSGVEEVEVTS